MVKSAAFDFHKISELLKALGHPARLRILMGLLETRECNVNKIVDKLKIPQSTASQHLGVLRTRGIITHRKDGVKACYRIADERISEILRILKK